MQTDTGQNACVAYCERRWPITTTTSCINTMDNTNVYGLGGLQQDHAMAVDCFNRSARLVNPWGMYNLAICFFYGWGVQPNHTAVLSLHPLPPQPPTPTPPLRFPCLPVSLCLSPHMDLWVYASTTSKAQRVRNRQPPPLQFFRV